MSNPMIGPGLAKFIRDWKVDPEVFGADPAFGLRPEPASPSRPTGFNPGERAGAMRSEVISFESFCRQFRVTAEEREKLAWHLGSYRLKRTVEELAA